MKKVVNFIYFVVSCFATQSDHYSICKRNEVSIDDSRILGCGRNGEFSVRLD